LNEGVAIKEISEIEKWWQRVADWRKDVRMPMGEIHASHPDNWETLGEINPKHWLGVDNAILDDYLTKLSMWQERLWSYIDNRTRNINGKE